MVQGANAHETRHDAREKGVVIGERDARRLWRRVVIKADADRFTIECARDTLSGHARADANVKVEKA
jgi:hypothetical protein